MITRICIILTLSFGSCTAPSPQTDIGVGMEMNRGHRMQQGNKADKIRVFAKGRSSVIFIFAEDGEVAEIPLDTLLKYYYLSKKLDDGNHK